VAYIAPQLTLILWNNDMSIVACASSLDELLHLQKMRGFAKTKERKQYYDNLIKNEINNLQNIQHVLLK
jgi:hypothetical protein